MEHDYVLKEGLAIIGSKIKKCLQQNKEQLVMRKPECSEVSARFETLICPEI